MSRWNPEPPEVRFWKHVNKLSANECWEWAGSRHYKGYGQFRLDKMVKAHRFSFKLAYPETGVKDSDVIMHKCDNPPCVNPNHLELGTHRLNCYDMIKKGRMKRAKGINTGLAKLTDDAVRSIRADSRPQREIARDYGVSQPLIGMVKRGEIWRHVI